MISGPGLDVDALREELGALGESGLVVGDGDLVRVHIHTADPAALIGVAAQRGGLSNLKVEDMTAQHHEILARADRTEMAGGAERPGGTGVAGGSGAAGVARAVGERRGGWTAARVACRGGGGGWRHLVHHVEGRRGSTTEVTARVGSIGGRGREPSAAAASRRFAVVAVAPGDGFREIFRSLGADAVVEGGQTMNPSIEDLLYGGAGGPGPSRWSSSPTTPT